MTYFKVFSNAEKFAELDDFRTKGYIFAIAKNTAMDILRKKYFQKKCNNFQTSYVIRYRGTNHVEVCRLYLGRGCGKWTSIKKWSTSENVSNQKSLFSQLYKVDKNSKYKVTGTVKVYDGKTLVDTISVESSEKTA